VAGEPAFPDVTVRTRRKRQTRPRSRLLPPYHVVLENDDYHSFEFVVGVLCKALGYPVEKSFLLTQEAHFSGRAVVWTGPKEVAELKAEQIRTFHEIREADNRPLGPLGCTVEPAPGP
jgi:ATP-dependent Clp protease adaptor protein ClpS